MARSGAYMQERAAPAARAVGFPQLSWEAKVAVAWTAAGAGAAGTLVSILLLLGRMHVGGTVAITVLLASVGGVLGLAHGIVLGYLGRHAAIEQPPRLRDHVFALLLGAAALVPSVLLAVWMVLSAALLRSGHFWGGPALLAGATLVLAIGAAATVLGWRSLERAYAEWTDHRIGAGLLAGSFVALYVVFLALRPAIPGTRLQLSATGWLIVAALATIWVATPAIVIALRLGRRSGTR